MWPDLAKFRHFGKTLKVFGYYLMVYFALGIFLNIIGQIFMTLDKFSLLLMARNRKDNLAIWSHCSSPTFLISMTLELIEIVHTCYEPLTLWLQQNTSCVRLRDFISLRLSRRCSLKGWRNHECLLRVLGVKWLFPYDKLPSIQAKGFRTYLF